MNRIFILMTALTAFFIAGLSSLNLAFAGDNLNPDWMVQNKDRLKNMAVNKVTLLGSHDAASSDVDADSPPCKGYLTHKMHHIKRMPKGKDVLSARCQSASIMDQLMYGVRYLDMRVAHQGGKYWSTHMWLSTLLFGEGGVFTQIKDFLIGHPDEIIILNFNELYSEHGPMDQEQETSFYKKVKKEFGSLLVPRGDFATTTLGNIWNGKGRIIIVGQTDSDPTSEKVIWDRGKVDSRWMDEKEQEVLVMELEQVLAEWKNGKSADKLRILQAMVTAGKKISNAKKTAELLGKKLGSDWKNYPFNVIQVDDSVNSRLMPMIIEMNRNAGIVNSPPSPAR